MTVLPVAAAAAGAALAWGWFEAGWVRFRRLDVHLPGLPDELRGLRIAHLSDFHLGVPSRGARAVERAAEWASARRPDLVCITGDLLTHPRGEPRLRDVLAQLPGAFVVLGNHDLGVSRDPFARRAAPFDVTPARLLQDEAAAVELRGRRVQLVGVAPGSHMARRARPEELADPAADLRILLCHFPRIVDRVPPGAFHLLLAGHLHDGQITVPTLAGKLRLAHPTFPYPRGLYRQPAATMHVSPGLGTTFVPFRFFARPEATELVLSS
ncbi:MAG: metallophosphoesterase family protein [Thermoleophilia bacterium]|nr:metallophosphoesterase family protein [Thermoleophilia bacterium]